MPAPLAVALNPKTISTAITVISTAKQGTEFVLENEEEIREIGSKIKEREVAIEKGDLHPRAIRDTVKDERKAVEALGHTFKALKKDDKKLENSLQALESGIEAVSEAETQDQQELNDVENIIAELEQKGLTNENMVHQAVKELTEVAEDLEKEIQVEVKILEVLMEAEKVEEKEIKEEETLEDEEEQIHYLIDESEEITKRFGDKKLYSEEEKLERNEEEIMEKTKKEEQNTKKLLQLTEQELDQVKDEVETTMKESEKLYQEAEELQKQLQQSPAFEEDLQRIEKVESIARDVNSKAENTVNQF